jgi:hypothetical protein
LEAVVVIQVFLYLTPVNNPEALAVAVVDVLQVLELLVKVFPEVLVLEATQEEQTLLAVEVVQVR